MARQEEHRIRRSCPTSTDCLTCSGFLEDCWNSSPASIPGCEASSTRGRDGRRHGETRETAVQRKKLYSALCQRSEVPRRNFRDRSALTQRQSRILEHWAERDCYNCLLL